MENDFIIKMHSRHTSDYEKKASTSEIERGKQHTTTRSPASILKLPNGINPVPFRITPPKIADLGKSSSLIILLVQIVL